MDTTLPFSIGPQPDDATCGPTCLHAIYQYYQDPICLDDVIAQVARWQEGGTLDVYLAIHALRRGYRATIVPFNLRIFDPTWANIPAGQIAEKLEHQLAFKNRFTGFEEVTRAYLEYLALGGKLRFEVLTPGLICRYLKGGTPILTGLSSTYLYKSSREFKVGDHNTPDDVRGQSIGHFVVLRGYRRKDRHVLVADPLVPNPMAVNRYYGVDIYRLICAIMLGILTFDGNLLIIRQR
jgi:hypothetical protein